jgi:hypothetical protein
MKDIKWSKLKLDFFKGLSFKDALNEKSALAALLPVPAHIHMHINSRN